MEELFCIVCGALIVQPKRGKKRTKFCSNECYRKDYHKNTQSYIDYKKEWMSKRDRSTKNYEGLCCTTCGALIIQAKTGPRRTKFCSKVCYEAHRRSGKDYKETKRIYDIEYRKSEKSINARTTYSASDRAKYVQRVSSLKKLFNLTEDMYRDLLDDQRGCCDICGESLDKACVDHCHKTGIVRGLLCNSCNTAIGHLKENVSVLNKAIIYLEKYGI